MRALPQAILGIAVATLLAACDGNFRTRVTFASFPTDYITSTEEIANTISDQADLFVDTRVLGPDEDKLTLLRNREIDFTFVSNSTRYTPDISAVMPLYKDVLHILVKRDIQLNDLDDLLDDKLIYIDAGSDITNRLLDVLRERSELGESAYRITHDPRDAPDIIFHFSPLLARDLSELEADYRFFSIGDPDDMSEGSRIRGLQHLFPQIEPFVIPAEVYDSMNPTPVLTLSVDSLLVTRRDTPALAVYWICKSLVRYKAMFADSFPAVYDYVGNDFDPNKLSFPLHPGARAYLDRNEPSFLERYAEVINMILYAIALIISALFALNRWGNLRKKNRIDVYYQNLMQIRQSIRGSNPATLQRLSDHADALEREAIDQLIREKLMANESMTIFLYLLRSTRDELARALQESEKRPN